MVKIQFKKKILAESIIELKTTMAQKIKLA